MSHFYPDIHLTRLKVALKQAARDIVLETVPLTAEFAVTPEPVTYTERTKLSYKPIAEGEEWGKTWDCGWFRLRGTVPQEWAGAYVTLRLDFAGEALVYDDAGCPWVGLTHGSVFDADYHKDMMHYLPECKGGEEVDVWVETGANSLFGVDRAGDPAYLEDQSRLHGHYRGIARSMRICRVDHTAWQLWIDLQVIESLVRTLPEDSTRRLQILRQASKALDVLPREGAAGCRAALRPIFEMPTDPAAIDVVGVGHAHIDTAWLWPVRETIRKCARTFASQLDLIERYPDYVFGASQAQLYEFTKEHYPELYAKIKDAVAAGRWEVQGAMWVEADCNLISGESMVRQVLHGKNYFRDEFGVDIRNLWLPDVFGYSGNLPQILKKAGVDYFLTQKLSWNLYNKFPHTTFIWQGIDGSEVLTHFPPEDTYNSSLMPDVYIKTDTNNSESGLVRDVVSLFGIGNGGGGPKEEYIERGQRYQNLNGLPRFHFGHGQSLLDKLEKYRDDLDTWQGELYFELHRGTLTTVSDIKLYNRRAEEALRATEMLCVVAGLDSYPAEELDRLWKDVLINQFHDIIPGSSINRVNVEAVEQLRMVVKRCRELLDQAAAKLLPAEDNAIAVFNPSSTPWRGVKTLPLDWDGATLNGESIVLQSEGGVLSALIEVPPRGFVTLRKGKSDVVATRRDATDLVLENDLVRYVFDESLQLIEGYDKETGRSFVVSDKPGNRLDIFEDRPSAYDAWEIEEYLHTMWVETAAVTGEIKAVQGPLRSGLEASLKIGNSTIFQQVWLEQGSKRLDFATQADWREDHKILRVAFPTTIVAQEAEFEIQYGTVARATHDNTKWNWAQFEVCGHRFADLSEPTHGVALLNDSKYGYRVKGSELSLTLLRSPTDPDPVADRQRHAFVYSLLPHSGDLRNSDVPVHAAILNQGVEVFRNRAADNAPTLPVSLEGEGVELAVLKRAEKEDALIVRLTENFGVRSKVRLVATANPQAQLVETDLMEWNTIGEAVTGAMERELGPYEIMTIKVSL